MNRVAGVILAAGASTRFGRAKQLLDWGGIPLVAHVADTALAAGLAPVVVVVGCAAEEVRAAVLDRRVLTVMNWRWEEGLSTSVQVGLALLPPDVAGALFLQCDQPLVTADLLRELVERFESTQAPVVYPTHAGRQATPVLFSRALFPSLAGVSGDQGGRAVIAAHAAEAASVDVRDPDLLADVDTPEDYQRLIGLRASRVRAADESPPPQASVLRNVRHLIIDMDGVLWRGDEPLQGLQQFFAFLREHAIEFVLATNNASKRPEEYVRKLARFGVELSTERVLTSAQASAAYLATIAPPGTPIYAVGMDGLHDALRERGFKLVEKDAHYVVVGWTLDLTWQQLAAATLQIDAGAQFIGTNPDVTFPSEIGSLPGNGATLAALEAATGVSPKIIGKPAPWLFHEALTRMRADAETTAVVGDRLATDILGGQRAGLTTILALSGVTGEADLAASPTKPDLVCVDVAHLTDLWQGVIE
jgi:4-nitrophenyl phosphatase